MRYLKYFLSFVLTMLGIYSFAGVSDTTTFNEIWDINSLTNINGHNVTASGSPKVVNTEKGLAVQFDGINDILVVDNNPIGNTPEFTFEVMFKPNSGQPNITTQPRFVCFWDPSDPVNGPRMTIEIRVTAGGDWYFDGYLKTDLTGLTLIDATKTHPTNQWMHAAVTYRNKTFTSYVNGVQELSGGLEYTGKVLNPTGRTSIGARFNNVNWFNGIIRAIKVTHKALVPAEFFSIPDTVVVTGIKGQVKNDSRIKIYPNPAKSQICIKDISGAGIQPLFCSITALSGHQVYKKVYTSNEWTNEKVIDISRLGSGIYFVAIQFPDYNVHQKISIIR